MARLDRAIHGNQNNKHTEMTLGYLLIVAGVGVIAFGLNVIRQARLNGFTNRAGRWFPPTDKAAIRKYSMGAGAFLVVGVIWTGLGVWLLVAPQSFLSLLPPG
jgi:hypothetical protein